MTDPTVERARNGNQVSVIDESKLAEVELQAGGHAVPSRGFASWRR